MLPMTPRLLLRLAALLLVATPAHSQGAGEQLLAAYPDHLALVEGNDLVWKDGTRMQIDDGRGRKSFEVWLTEPDLKDMLVLSYAAGEVTAPPPENHDPGRARNAAFFAKMYGDCAKGEVARNLVEVVWLPKRGGQKLKVSKVNRVADKLEAVSRALDELPETFDVYLKPSEGTYVCRAIEGTSQVSAHGYGIAIDIATKNAHYWRWNKGGPGAYQNKVPIEIVKIFEANGFIWGGKWWHYDTMHFEYRPELLGK
jgi:hypothetical protein